MPRPGIADCPGLTIDSGLVNTDIAGNLRRNRSAELATHCAGQSLRTEPFASGAHTGIGQSGEWRPRRFRWPIDLTSQGLADKMEHSERPPAAAIRGRIVSGEVIVTMAIKNLDLGQGPTDGCCD
jgi:hypothetical protein